MASVDDNITNEEENDTAISGIAFRSFLPSSTILYLISHFTSSCIMLQTWIDALSDPKHGWPSFAFRRDSHKRTLPEKLLLFRLRRALILNDLRRVGVPLGTPHPVIEYKGMMSNGKYLPSVVTPFWTDSEHPLLCNSCHCVRIFSQHISTFCDNCLGMQCDPSLKEEDKCDDESMPPLFTRNDDDSSDDNDDSSDEDDDTTVSVNEFDDDINVVIKDINGDQCHFLLCPSLSVNLVKQQYFELVGLHADQQRLFLRGKMMSDDDNIHSHGVVDRSIIHLVR